MESSTFHANNLTSHEPDFEKIYNHKFEDDAKFLEGWKKVICVIPKEKLLDSLIKAQTYYYSREVDPVDYAKYRSWLTENEKDLQCFDKFLSDELLLQSGASSSETSSSEPEPSSSTSADTQKDLVLNSSKSEDTDSKNAATNTETNNSDFVPHESVIGEVKDAESINYEEAKHPANFMELAEMIQAGMKLPDTEDLNIQPLNEDPTPCDSQRPRKPWDVS